MSILGFLKLLETWLHNEKKNLDAWTSLGEDYLPSVLMWKMTLLVSEPSCGHYSWNIGTMSKHCTIHEHSKCMLEHGCCGLGPWHIGLYTGKTATKVLLPTAKSLQPRVSTSNLQLQSHDSKGLIFHSPAGWPSVPLAHTWECWDKISLLPKYCCSASLYNSPLCWTIILCHNKEKEGGYETLLSWLNELLFWLSDLWKHIGTVGLTQMWSKAALT